MNTYVPATQPTIYFIGVTTTQSSIMRVFPEWAKALGLKDAVIKGIDFKPHLSKTILFLWARWLPRIRSICTMPAKTSSNIWIHMQ